MFFLANEIPLVNAASLPDASQFAPTKRSAMKLLAGAFRILNEASGELSRKDLIAAMERNIDFERWELERYESNGQIKWLTIFLFYSVNCVKAGWLVKNKGTWFLTDEGRKVVELSPVALFNAASEGYKAWDKARKGADIGSGDTDEGEPDISDEQVQEATLEEVASQARESIGRYLESMDEFAFQKLCAILIKAMGYHIDFISPPGKDGGIDIVAFKDPLGFSKPKLKVQVKRYNEKNKIDTDKIKILKGVLHSGEDIGVYITSGYFTRDAERFAREGSIHMKLIDRDSFIDHWQEHYAKLSDKEKSMLPLQPIYFLGSFE